MPTAKSYPYRAEARAFLINGSWLPADQMPMSDAELRDRVSRFRGTSLARHAEYELARRKLTRVIADTALFRFLVRRLDWLAIKLGLAPGGALLYPAGMSHSPSRRQVDKHLRALRYAEARQRASDDAAAAAYARRIVALWNARACRRQPSFYPTFRTAVAAGTPKLTFMCPACHQVGEADLRTFDRHPDAAISSIISNLSCQCCSPNPPFARLLHLSV